MNLETTELEQAGTADSVLTELWRVKDARSAQFGNAAGLMQHLQTKYGAQHDPILQELYEVKAQLNKDSATA